MYNRIWLEYLGGNVKPVLEGRHLGRSMLVLRGYRWFSTTHLSYHQSFWIHAQGALDFIQAPYLSCITTTYSTYLFMQKLQRCKWGIFIFISTQNLGGQDYTEFLAVAFVSPHNQRARRHRYDFPIDWLTGERYPPFTHIHIINFTRPTLVHRDTGWPNQSFYSSQTGMQSRLNIKLSQNISKTMV